jgi:hypothetical protein
VVNIDIQHSHLFVVCISYCVKNCSYR